MKKNSIHAIRGSYRDPVGGIRIGFGDKISKDNGQLFARQHVVFLEQIIAAFLDCFFKYGGKVSE